MNRPWEIMMNFQKKLKPGATASGADGDKNTQVQLSAAAQRFLPSTSLVPSRVHQVRNIINESTRIIEETRLPELNNTTASFCQNCTCNSCSNLSILNGTQLNNPTVNTLLQAFENYLNVQKQQFMAMIQQIASLDSSASSNFFSSSTSCSRPAVTECDSSVIANHVEAVFSNYDNTKRNGGNQDTRLAPSSTSSSQSPTRTLDNVDMEASSQSPMRILDKVDKEASSQSVTRTLDEVDKEELSGSTVCSENDELTETVMNVETCIKDKTSPISSTSNNQNDKDTTLIISKNDSGDERLSVNHRVNLGEDSDFGSFDDYCDQSFRPVRKSSLLKMRESFVVLENLDPVEIRQCDIKPLRTDIKSNFRVPVNPESKKKPVLATVEVPRTRSGRTVKKPQAYWTAGSRVGIKGELPEDTEEEAPLQRRLGCNVNNRTKAKQNVQKKSKISDSKIVLSEENISFHTPNSELLTTSSKNEKYPIVSSSSDALVMVPPRTGVKRGSATNPDSSHGTRNASKNISTKKRKVKSQPKATSVLGAESATNPDPSYAARDASKSISTKKRKIESQIMKATTIDSKHEEISSAATKSQYNTSKRNTRRGIQNENSAVVSTNTKKTTQREEVKEKIRKKNTLKPKMENSKKSTEKERDFAFLQLQNDNTRYPSLSGNLSSVTEPEYECYFDGNLSD